MHVGYGQTVIVGETESDVPFNTHVYETGHLHMPRRTFFQKTKLFASGKVIRGHFMFNLHGIVTM